MGVLEEQIEIVRRTWADGTFSFCGTHYTVDHLDARPKPLSQRGPRLILGGNGGKRSVAAAARWADEYNSPDASDVRLQTLRAELDAACLLVARDPATLALSVLTGVLVAKDRPTLEQRADRAARFVGLPRSATPIDQLPDSWLIGDPDEVIDGLYRLRRLGADRVILWLPDHSDLRMLDLLGITVAEALDSRVA
jgi:alkanesulfonate monooxygenase SsuD/methylene tetrahydromethanopterin reductase-like flavin-dependent oxidoreductase (luciferase family)